MGVNYLWDTNTVIYYLQKQFPFGAEKFIDTLLQQHVPVISAITEIELLCWKTATEKDLQLLYTFINDAMVIELEQSIKLKAAELRKSFNLKLPDAIIAATAVVHNHCLLSRNVKDFRNIEGLEFINPWEK